MLVESEQLSETADATLSQEAGLSQSESFSWEEFINLWPHKRRERKNGAAPVRNLFEWALAEGLGYSM